MYGEGLTTRSDLQQQRKRRHFSQDECALVTLEQKSTAMDAGGGGSSRGSGKRKRITHR